MGVGERLTLPLAGKYINFSKDMFWVEQIRGGERRMLWEIKETRKEKNELRYI